MKPPLFIPLRTEYFNSFAAGSKTVEWRKFGPRFNEATLSIGRRVTLSHGYSGARLYGRIISLEMRLASKVSGATAIYGARALLVGIHIKLLSRRPQPH